MFENFVFPGALELSAMLFTVWCVYLAVKRNIWTYPIGLIGTTLYFFFFLPQSLPLALLQVVFTVDQLYGWWFWIWGDKGKAPPIRRSGWERTILWSAVAALGGYIFGKYMSQYPTALMGPWDTAIAATSLVAQLFLDRKKLENWGIWLVVNTVSVYFFWTQGWYASAILYVILWFNAFYGYREWKREYDSRGERWLEENKEAIDSYNKYVDENGLPLGGGVVRSWEKGTDF